jgi:hypothetical protein
MPEFVKVPMNKGEIEARLELIEELQAYFEKHP